MNYQQIQFSVLDAVARISLNRAQKMNSFNSEMHTELRMALEHVQSDTAIRALIITGNGRGFCAGQDLADPQVRITPGETPPDLGNLVEHYYKPMVLQLAHLRVPTIAAVNGIAAGAGFSLALACDIVIASKSASFMLPFSKIGLIPDTGCSWNLPKKIGHARALGLALTGNKLSAEKALAWGMIWDVVEDDVFQQSVDNLAQQLVQMPTDALVKTREVMLRAHTNSLEEQLSLETDYIRILGNSADYAEGVTAFLQKRTPKYT